MSFKERVLNGFQDDLAYEFVSDAHQSRVSIGGQTAYGVKKMPLVPWLGRELDIQSQVTWQILR